MISKNIKIQILVYAIAIVAVASVFVLAQPNTAHALGTAANLMCEPWKAECGCNEMIVNGKCKTKANTYKCGPGICEDVTNKGITKGICVGFHDCQGVSFSELAGQKGGAVDTGLKALKGILDKVMKSLGGGGGSSATPQTTTQTTPSAPVTTTSQAFESSAPIKTGTDSTRTSAFNDILNNTLRGGNETQGSSQSNTIQQAFNTSNTGGTESQKSGDPNNILNSEFINSSGGSEGRNSRIQITPRASSNSDVSGGRSFVDSDTGESGTTVTPTQRGDSQFASKQRSEGGSESNLGIVDAILEARLRNELENSEVSGFFGIPDGSESDSVIGRLCASRPWSRSFVSRVIPDSFFDGLCIRRGYQIGPISDQAGVQPAADVTAAENLVRARIEDRVEPNIIIGEPGLLCRPEFARPGEEINLSFSCGESELTATAGFSVLNSSDTSATVQASETAQYGIRCANENSYSCIVQVFDPRVLIWADPERVPPGTRTTIFWNTEDVFECVVGGPSFTETGPFGGASTVPITGVSEYEISCIAPNGEEVSESTVVDLSI